MCRYLLNTNTYVIIILSNAIVYILLLIRHLVFPICKTQTRYRETARHLYTKALSELL